ncbi:hypothetical protein NQ314_016462 [Rhamnusium bicolor]|uniref:DUF4774 domain-containing protein n=1 Tax=Rhamnusium bicolor TaxID=1586634 RepID=A0AAV8WWQ5_9CUCU|nr:hypothetical protein NQ314_016462 [Rhamnusium bicolor]
MFVTFSRVQPQIVFYGPGGQGQPILFNPGSPPGNFLVPHHPQPGPNVILRNTPQRPVFVAGYPKPAHIPPIEKDAEEIPTNPARIPPFPSPTARKPEKLETFNEGKIEYPAKSAGEAEVLGVAGRNPQLIPRNNLKPGQQANLKYAQPQPEQIPLPTYQQSQALQRQKEIDLNTIPIQTLLLRNAVTGQISNVQDLSVGEKFPENLITLNQPTSQEAFFRSNLPVNIVTADENIQPIGQFRFSPPSEPYFSLEGEDVENDAIVIDAKVEDEATSSSNADSDSEPIPNPQKAPEPSTAQAAPGAIALAGPGGVAGAAPRGTALVGKGGLAVASPQATAVAGPSKPEEKDKKSTRKTK